MATLTSRIAKLEKVRHRRRIDDSPARLKGLATVYVEDGEWCMNGNTITPQEARRLAKDTKRTLLIVEYVDDPDVE